jgi:outer membrane protein OmpA-like peptidoglycan-associated protein
MRKPASASLLAGLLALSLSGCSLVGGVFGGGDKTDPCDAISKNRPESVPNENVALIAPTTTFVDLTEALSAAKTDVMAALTEEFAQLSTVIADGGPEIKRTVYVRYPALATETDKPVQQEKVFNSIKFVYKCSLKASTSNYKQVPESDLLGALGAASSTFQNTTSPKNIFVMSNGLQTAGQISFLDGIPSKTETPGVVDSLKAQGALPNLTGVSVHWYGLGQVDGENQPNLNQQSIDALEAFWTELIRQSGGSLDKVVRQIVVKAPRDGSIEQSAVQGLADACLVQLDEASGFSFVPDKADFIDEETSFAAAQGVVEQLKNNPNCTGALTVTGFAASGVAKSAYNQGQKSKVKSLSLNRANAFKRLLEEAGFNGKIVTVGGGKGTVNDWDSNGKFVESLGKKNRIVTISQGGN